MANTVRIPYSNTSGNVPGTLGNGVLGINQASGALYYRNSSGVVTLFSPAASLSDGSVTTAKLADPLVYDCGAYAALVPAVPTGLTVTASTGQAALAWTAPTNTGGAAITDYSIQYSSNAGSTYTTFSHTASTATTATITSLATGSYLFRVAAINSVGTGTTVTSSSTSVTAAATTSNAPTGLSVTPTTGQAALSWTAPSDNGGASITDYSIQYSSNAGSSYTTFAHSASTTTIATITSLATGSYLFRVAAINSAGTGSYVTSSSTSITAGGGATLSSFNSIWNAVGFTGSGTAASPYTKTWTYTGDIGGAQFTVVSAGTLRITGSLDGDYGITFYKNGTALGSPPSIADAYSGAGGGYTLNVSISVAANDVIVIGDIVGGHYLYSIPLNIWWQ